MKTPSCRTSVYVVTKGMMLINVLSGHALVGPLLIEFSDKRGIPFLPKKDEVGAER